MPLAVDFQPPSLAAIVDSALLKRALMTVCPERDDGEICIFELEDEDLLQVSLFFPGEPPIHLEMKPGWIYSPGFEAQVRERIASAVRTYAGDDVVGSDSPISQETRQPCQQGK